MARLFFTSSIVIFGSFSKSSLKRLSTLMAVSAFIKIFSSAFGKTVVPISLPSITIPFFSPILHCLHFHLQACLLLVLLHFHYLNACHSAMCVDCKQIQG